MSAKRPEWNEIDFVPWRSFRQMAPSIIGLEISRLSGLIEGTTSIEVRNLLVRARHELREFVRDLEQADDQREGLDTIRLEMAIVSIPLNYPEIDPQTLNTLEYILDRLQYVRNRIQFVYQ